MVCGPLGGKEGKNKMKEHLYRKTQIPHRLHHHIYSIHRWGFNAFLFAQIATIVNEKKNKRVFFVARTIE